MSGAVWLRRECVNCPKSILCFIRYLEHIQLRLLIRSCLERQCEVTRGWEIAGDVASTLQRSLETLDSLHNFVCRARATESVIRS